MSSILLFVSCPLFPALGATPMSAEQHTHTLSSERTRPPEWKYDPKKHLDVYSIYVKFWDDLQKVGKEEARHRRRRLLEAHFRSYTQENNALPAIYPVAIEAMRRETHPSSLRFRHTYHEDIEAGQKEELARIGDHKIRERFAREQETYTNVWNTALENLLPHLGKKKDEFISVLHQQGFVHRVARRNIYELEKKNGSARDGIIFDAISGASALYEELHNETEVEIYESPQWYAFISPNTPIHQDGKTSIGRLAKAFYVPLLDKVFLADEGLYSGYRGELNELLQLDKQKRPIPTMEKDLLAFVAVLSEEYSSVAPHAIFQEIINSIGYFTPAPIGEGVKIKETRDFSRQIYYIEQILDFEYERCIQKPELLHTLSDRFTYANTTVMHALLRANDDSLDVDSLVGVYKKVFSLDLHAYNPTGVKRLMDVQTVKVYSDFLNRAQSLGDCAFGTLRVGGLEALVNPSIDFSSAGLAFGAGFDLGDRSFAKLKEGINYRRAHDFSNSAEARAFAEIYAINPEWIGTVIQHFPEGKKCDECDHLMHWVGTCGDHTMCLQCNAEYNLENGLVPGYEGIEVQGNVSSTQIEDVTSTKRMGLSDFVAGLGNPELVWKTFLIQKLSLLES